MKSKTTVQDTFKPQVYSEADVQRKFVFGDDWLYVLIYTGSTFADKLLTEIIKPFCEDLHCSGRIEKWFSKHYQDPQPNLRLRFFSKTSSVNCSAIIADLKERLPLLIKQGLAEKFVVGTYDRELERSGASDTRLAETIFLIDSRFVTDTIIKITRYGADDTDGFMPAN